MGEVAPRDKSGGGGREGGGGARVPEVRSELSDRMEIRKWFPLSNKEGTNDGKDYGQLLLALWHCNDPSSNPPLDKGYIDELESLPPVVPATVAPPAPQKGRQEEGESRAGNHRDLRKLAGNHRPNHGRRLLVQQGDEEIDVAGAPVRQE